MSSSTRHRPLALALCLVAGGIVASLASHPRANRGGIARGIPVCLAKYSPNYALTRQWLPGVNISQKS